LKNVINTITILLLLFGVGLIIPRMIPAGAALASHFQKEDPNVEGTAETFLESDSAAGEDASEENAATSSAEDKITTDTEENFPIKTAEEDKAFSDKSMDDSEVAASDVDNRDADVDKTETPDESSDAKNAAKSGETKVPEAPAPKPAAPASAPPVKTELKPAEITYKAVSYTRWVTTPLNMRKGPGKEHAVITSLPVGQVVTVTAIASNGWAKVTSDGKEGYVSGRYLSETEVKKPAAPVVQAAAPAPQGASYEAYKMYVGGKAITYKNGGIADGQRIIDSSSSLISTWGGAEIYSGNDGYNTHFIGHNPGIFSVLTKVGNGNTIIVTDGKGHPTTYKVTRIFTVDDNAYNAKDGENYYNYMVSRRGGEVITLQTCLGSNKNLVIRAEK